VINEEYDIHEYVDTHLYIHTTYIHNTYMHIYVHTHTHTHTHTYMHVYNVTVSSIKLIRLQTVRQKPNPDSTFFEILTRLAPQNSRFIY